jgi:hypothetical protein
MGFPSAAREVRILNGLETIKGATGSLKNLNDLPQSQKERIYQDLIPPLLFSDVRWRAPGCNAPSQRYVCPAGLGLVRIEVRRSPADKDCIFFMQAVDTPYGQIELSLCIINDMDAQRFNIDSAPNGRDNCLGTLKRNIPEEICAMNAGLCPHQVRSGLGLFREFFFRFEQFVGRLGVDTIIAEPLSYNNAIQYEELGFRYISGFQFMTWIDREFQPEGVLALRLDNSTPFRKPEMSLSVRGRSWAIHDGILRQSWDGIKIFKTVGDVSTMSTFPGHVW